MKKSAKILRMGLVFLATAISLLGNSIQAQEIHSLNQADILKAFSVVKSERSKVLKSFAKGDLAPYMQKALEALVSKGIQLLQEKNFQDEALRYRTEWNQFYTMSLDGLRVLDLGDHKPLFDWLAEFYVTLENKLGKDLCKFSHLEDLKFINYGAPVAIFPNGDPRTGESYDINEYREHFVPFTSAVLYWSMNIACNTAFSFIPHWFCSWVSLAPRYGYQTYVADNLSDYVYKKATGNNPATFVLTSED